ncbi:hypothetical protein SAY86_021023 [Trapa natans]|uniref:Uncharacterized protein n=1 Tax=Trapa natans TaxID=22666 RepID=A0AAN7RJM8_TRANT|nr:hypothetical protein SAY86_021023 [Trapa natans]
MVMLLVTHLAVCANETLSQSGINHLEPGSLLGQENVNNDQAKVDLQDAIIKTKESMQISVMLVNCPSPNKEK